MIDRPRYTEWLLRWRDRDVIKVVTGMRRCGKSTVLALYREILLQSGISPNNVLSINFESMEHDYPREARPLYNYVVEHLNSGMNYVFLDEVQHVSEFERVVDALAIRDDVDLYITGSNAYFLSRDLATLLTGRYVEIEMLPLSFAEYRSAYPAEQDANALLNRYMAYGGLPYITQLDNDQDREDYLGGVFNTIVVKDIAQRRARIDMGAFQRTALFLADNVGNPTSLNRIARGLSAGGFSISPTTVGEYIDALVENFLLYRARRYDIKGRAYLQAPEKYYLGDLGLRYYLLGTQAGEVGHRLENIVYLELRRRFQHVSIGKTSSQEIDFVASSASNVHYFQVALSVLDENTLARELSAFDAISDNYPKTLLTLDRIGTGDFSGIQHVNVIDWLLE